VAIRVRAFSAVNGRTDRGRPRRRGPSSSGDSANLSDFARWQTWTLPGKGLPELAVSPLTVKSRFVANLALVTGRVGRRAVGTVPFEHPFGIRSRDGRRCGGAPAVARIRRTSGKRRGELASRDHSTRAPGRGVSQHFARPRCPTGSRERSRRWLRPTALKEPPVTSLWLPGSGPRSREELTDRVFNYVDPDRESAAEGQPPHGSAFGWTVRHVIRQPSAQAGTCSCGVPAVNALVRITGGTSGLRSGMVEPRAGKRPQQCVRVANARRSSRAENHH
jgi:hypothetical protein